MAHRVAATRFEVFAFDFGQQSFNNHLRLLKKRGSSRNSRDMSWALLMASAPSLSHA